MHASCLRILATVLLLLAPLACRPPSAPESTPTMKPAAPESVTTPAPADPITRLRIGEPTHTYPLAEEIPPAPRLDEPNLNVQRYADGTITLTLPLAHGEAIWGFGQRFDAFNLRGVHLETWTTDGWNATDTSYFAVPFFISSRGYGLFVNHPGRIAFDLGANDPNRLTIRIPDRAVEVYAFTGTPDTIARRYTQLIGRPRPLPDWVFRPWVSRNSFLGAYEVDRVVDRMASLGMPVGAAVLEAWAEQLHNFRFTEHRYPDPATWIRRLNDRGVQVICWITSSVWPDSEAHRQARDRGFLVRNEDGSEHVVRWLENGRKIDLRSPAARAWWRDLHKPLIEQGVAGFKTDGGEHMPDPLFHNLHTFHYQQAALDAFRDLGRPGMTFARSASAPNASLGAYWAGDQHADWRGLAMAVRGGLSAAISGFPHWGHDIGGYSGTPTKDLYLRWLQFGAFTPIMQLHGITAREPWHYDDETIAIARFYFQLRAKLHDRIVAWSEEARTHGTPIIRPLVWTAPDDPATYSIDNQFLFGPDLLVAPITDPLDERGIYLPAGAWVDAWTGERREGPARFLHHAPLARIPVFIRAEHADAYRDVFTGAPAPSTAPVTVALAGPRNDRGLVPTLRPVRDTHHTETIVFEIRNHGDQTALLSVEPRTTAGCRIEPADRLNLRLAPGENQRLAYHATPRSAEPASHPVTLLVQHDQHTLPAPVVTLAVPPAWHVLGPFDGGVGSTQPFERTPPDLTATWPGKHGRTLRWTDVPPSLIQPDGAIDLTSLTGPDGSSTTYLLAEITSDRVRPVTFHAGFGDAMTLWLNGRLLTTIDAHRNAERDEDRITATLQSGKNTILIRNSRDLAPPIFHFRLSH
ncbi:MAG TPA: glycoside hydrolase family 31 protein [Kiritimatiellia bacterium]|nr:glycoside hydrolase family 31 protein [Kiritimatiellia bacterium]HMP32924.1 glycoside hydrolase family 31 protein [Kiritimatiellia bacterium]